MKLHILAFGAHPDDVEIGMGGTIAKYTSQGYHVGICNLTHAELSSNGTIELRQQEADKATNILGVQKRIQLDFRDRGLSRLAESDLSPLVSLIRRHQPEIVFSPFEKDRHPDHGACTNLIKEAVFNAGIHRYRCIENLPAYRPKNMFLYFINGFDYPDFVIDVSHFMDKKKEALLSYESQFTKGYNSVDTPLTNGYIATVEARDRLFGKEVGLDYAEGFMTTRPLVISDLTSFS